MSTTKHAIIALAHDLIRRKTYSSFSYDDIARELHLTKAAIHYHFKTKEDLGLAVCRAVGETLAARHAEAVSAAANGRHPWCILEDRLAALATCGICPLLSLQSDFENLPPALQAALADLVRAEMQSIQDVARAWNPHVDAHAVVTLVLSLKTARQYQRVLGHAVFDALREAIRTQFYALVPEQPLQPACCPASP